MISYKAHSLSTQHQQKMETIFPNETMSGSAPLPYIVFIDRHSKYNSSKHGFGLHLLTLCVSRETLDCFYLCHVCETKCPTGLILGDLYTRDHCSNYFSYTDPNLLSFCWMPSMDMRDILRSQIQMEVSKSPYTLQILHLPKSLMNKVQDCTYTEVMNEFRKNENLLKRIEAAIPERTVIQSYQNDSGRKHPLIGMRHIVECVCVGQTKRRHYLCTLCKLTIGTHAIIRHVLSFDHVFAYFKVWHPSTLLTKECYSYSDSFVDMMLNFAKQTEEIHGAASTEMKQVMLDPAEFESVNFKSYTSALQKLEVIVKEKHGSSLVTHIVPGSKLELQSQPVKVTTSGSTDSDAPCFKVHCQDCSIAFETFSDYLQHLSNVKHKETVKQLFKAGSQEERTVYVKLDLYSYLQTALKQNQPVVGASLVVACVSSQALAETIYICFACEDCFLESSLRQHMDCDKHLIQTLLYLNPWRLPFAWTNYEESLKGLRETAWEEDGGRPKQMLLLKVLDIPKYIYDKLTPSSYQAVMKQLTVHHALIKREVPPKLKQKERFPLLGKSFLVKYDQCVSRHHCKEKIFPCLLCAIRLTENEFHAHVYSAHHVEMFLNSFHPGSLSSNPDAETLLDLAKQAAQIHPILNVQEIKLDRPIWEPCPYETVISILAQVKKRHGGGGLEPRIKPKAKLFPRETPKEAKIDQLSVASQEKSPKMRGHDHKASPKSIVNTENTLKKVSTETNSGHIGKSHTTGAGNAEEQAVKKTTKGREMLSKRCHNEVKKAAVETSLQIKQEKLDEILEPGKKASQGKGREITEGVNKSSLDLSRQIKQEKMEEVRKESEKSCLWIKQEKTDATMEKEKGDVVETCRRINQEKVDVILEEVKKLGMKPCLQETRNAVMEVGKTAGMETCQGTNHEKIGEIKKEVKKADMEPASVCREIKKEMTVELMEIKKENMEESIWEITERSPLIDGGEGAELGKGSASKDVPSLFKICTYKENKRKKPSGKTEKSQETECSPEDLCKDLGIKRKKTKWLVPEKESPSLSSEELKLVTTIVQEESLKIINDEASKQTTIHGAQLWHYLKKENREPVVGLGDLVECFCDQRGPIYLCKCCSVKLTDAEIVDHVSGFDHQSLYLLGTQKIPPPQGNHQRKKLRQLAVSYERDKGHGEATVVDVDEEVFSRISKQSFHSALQALRPILTWQNGCSPLPLNPAPPATQPVQVSVAPHLQPALQSGRDDIQTIIIDPEDEEMQPSLIKAPTSVMAETSKATQKTSSPHVSKIGTNTTVERQKLSPNKVEMAQTEHTPTTATHSKPMVPVYKRMGNSSKCSPGGAHSTTVPTLAANTSSASAFTTVSGASAAITKPAATTTICTATSSEPTTVSIKQTGRTSASSACISSVAPAAKSARLTKPTADTFGAASETTVTTPKPRPASGTAPMAESETSVLNAVAAAESKTQSTAATDPTTGNTKKPRLGLHKIITVTSGNKRQVYCQVCVVRLNESKHLSSKAHVIQCVKKMYPGVLSKISESAGKIDMVVADLAEIEKKLGNWKCQSVEVTDEVYYELRDRLDAKAAIERLRIMLGQSLSPCHSPDDPEESLRLKLLLSSYETSKPNDVPGTPQHEGPDIFCQAEQEDVCAPDPVKRRRLDPDQGEQAQDQVSSTVQSPDHVPEELGHEDPPAQTTRKSQETLETSDSEIIRMSSSPGPSSGLWMDIEEQEQSSPDLKEECSATPEPEQDIPSEVLPSLSPEERNQDGSLLSTYLSERQNKSEPIIGLNSVWECQGASGSLHFLCESCEETLSLHDILQHMVQTEHSWNCMRKYYAHFLRSFWLLGDLTNDYKMTILYHVVDLISVRESVSQVDAQCVQLRPELMERVQTSPFSEALQIVRGVKEQEKRSLLCPLASSPQQNGSRQQAAAHPSREETVTGGDCGAIKHQKVSSPLDVSSVSTRALPVLSPIPVASTSAIPQETPMNVLSPLEQSQPNLISKLQVKREETEYQAPQTADLSIETPMTQLGGYAPGNLTHGSQPPHQPSPGPAPESCVRPAASFIPRSGGETETGPGSDQEGSTVVNWSMVNHLIELVKQRKSETILSPCKPALGHAEATPECTDNSKAVQTEVKMEFKSTRWNCRQVATSVENHPIRSSASVKSNYDHQRVVPHALSPVDSSPAQNSRATSDPVSSGIVVNSVSTARPHQLQHQSSSHAQNSLGHKSKPQPHLTSMASNSDTVADSIGVGQQDTVLGVGQQDTVLGVGQQPIPFASITNAQCHNMNWKPNDHLNRREHPEAKGGTRDTHGFPAVQNASVAPVSSGGFSQYTLTSYLRNRSDSENSAGYTPPVRQMVYPQSSYQHEHASCLFYPTVANQEHVRQQAYANVYPPPPLQRSVILDQQQQQLRQQQEEQLQQWRQQQPREQEHRQQWQQQHLQQQPHHCPWTTTAPSSRFGSSTNDTVNSGAGPLANPHSFSQTPSGLNVPSTSGVIPMQSSSNAMPQNFYQVYNRPPTFNTPPRHPS